MYDPIVKTIEVPCNQKMAFEVFIEQMDSWWPMGKFTTSAMSGTPAKSIRVEAKEGGDIVEIGPDGDEHYWGTILKYDPYDLLSVDFHITTPHEERGPGSKVDIVFTVLDDERTKVALTQTGWEVFGDKERIEGIRGGYDFGWNLIFVEGYKKACGG